MNDKPMTDGVYVDRTDGITDFWKNCDVKALEGGRLQIRSIELDYKVVSVYADGQWVVYYSQEQRPERKTVRSGEGNG